ncbi:hypothetical protein Tco_1542065 [Tanacetum coccineum]
MILGHGWPWDQRGYSGTRIGTSAATPPPLDTARTIPQRLGRLEEDVLELRRDVGSLHGLVEISMTDQGRYSMWMMLCMTHLIDASGLTY